MNQPLLKETLFLFARRLYTHHPGRLEQIGNALRYFGIGFRAVFLQLRESPLMKDDQAQLLTRERRVQELAGKQSARIGEHKYNETKLTALSFVHGQRVGQLKNNISVLRKITRPIRVAHVGLG